jgi:hypothetical protein
MGISGIWMCLAHILRTLNIFIDHSIPKYCTLLLLYIVKLFFTILKITSHAGIKSCNCSYYQKWFYNLLVSVKSREKVYLLILITFSFIGSVLESLDNKKWQFSISKYLPCGLWIPDEFYRKRCGLCWVKPFLSQYDNFKASFQWEKAMCIILPWRR